MPQRLASSRTVARFGGSFIAMIQGSGWPASRQIAPDSWVPLIESPNIGQIALGLPRRQRPPVVVRSPNPGSTFRLPFNRNR